MVKGGRSSVVEFQPSKLAVVGSNPIARSIPRLTRPGAITMDPWRPDKCRKCCGLSSGEIARPGALMIVRDGMKPNVFRAHVAQLVEHVLGKDEVTRSIRVVGSIPSLLDPERLRLCATG